MRLTRWRDLSALEKLAFNKRFSRCLKTSVVVGVGMGLMRMPNAFMSIAHPEDSVWAPLIYGVWVAVLGFAMMFFVATRVKAWMPEDDELVELNERIALEKQEAQRIE